jgi:hypothetical protein
MAAHLKQLLVFVDAFRRREVSHLLAFLAPFLLFDRPGWSTINS